ncbi:MAG: hypothetical protein WCZ66_05675 [Sphingomonadaceae bacterium]
MYPLRRMIARYPSAVAALLLAGLLLRLLVPAGFMPVAGNGGITVVLCTDAGLQQVYIAMPRDGDAAGSADLPPTVDQPCAFGSLLAPLTGGADAILLALALVFILLAGIRRHTSSVSPRLIWLRPPSHAPPAFS